MTRSGLCVMKSGNFTLSLFMVSAYRKIVTRH